MGNFFKDLKTRFVIDYNEWRQEWIIKWNMRRRIRQVRHAIDRAKAYHERDRKTYYIFEDPSTGGVSALNSSDIKLLTRKGILKRMTILERFEKSIDIISSNQQIINQYREVKQSKAKTNERSDEGKH